MAAEPQSPMATLFATFTGYQRAAAIRAAIEIDLFTAIGEGNRTPPALAQRCGAAERGVRMLADAMAAVGFLAKQNGAYALTPDSEAFLDRRSPAYMGSAVRFLASERVVEGFQHLTEAVRKGGTALADDALTPEHPIWVDFAEAMAPIAKVTAELVAIRLAVEADPPGKVLDIAAGHGFFGITLAKHNPKLEIVALDWRNVLAVAARNAREAGIGDRFRALPGDALTTDFGTDYDVVLITNLLHHFDAATCEKLLRKVYAALKPGGRAVTVEFIPDEGRTSPAEAATFSLVMLAMTPAGDAYTFAELDRMLRNAGFTENALHSLEPAVQRVIVSTKR